MPLWMRWMLVDSSGSTKPLDRPERDDVAIPGELAPPGGEGEVARLGERLALEIGEQHARAPRRPPDARSNRRWPLPMRCCSGMRHCQPGGVRGRAGERIGIARIAARHRDRAVAGQPVRPVLVAGIQRLLDQQPAKARAVDEQVALDDRDRRRASTEFDEAALAVERRRRRSCLRCGCTPRVLGIVAQEFRIEAGVEVEGVDADCDKRRPRVRRPDGRSGPCAAATRSSTRPKCPAPRGACARAGRAGGNASPADRGREAPNGWK